MEIGREKREGETVDLNRIREERREEEKGRMRESEERRRNAHLGRRNVAGGGRRNVAREQGKSAANPRETLLLPPLLCPF